MTNTFGEFDNFPRATEDTPRIVFTFVKDLDIFQPTLIDHRTGKEIVYTRLFFEDFKPTDTNLRGRVMFKDQESGNPDIMPVVFDIRVEE